MSHSKFTDCSRNCFRVKWTFSCVRNKKLLAAFAVSFCSSGKVAWKRRRMRPPLLRVVLHSLMTSFCLPTRPAPESCVAFESSYHIDRACQCAVYESNGPNGGVFHSTGHPQPYPASVNCMLYTFIGDLNEIVEITFLEFDLPVPFVNSTVGMAVCLDYVRLHLDLERPELSDGSALQQSSVVLCGDLSTDGRPSQRRFYSSKRSLIVEFHSDRIHNNNTGFEATYRFIDKGQFEMVGASRRWGLPCVFDFYSNRNVKRGSFFSPRYPQNYPPGVVRCLYVFHGLRDERVFVAFQNIRLASHSATATAAEDTKCPGDSLTVVDGTTNTTGSAPSSVLARICGDGGRSPDLGPPSSVDRKTSWPLPQETSSSGHQLTVEFRSDGAGDQGFAGTYEFRRSPPLRVSRTPGPSSGLLRPTTTTTQFPLAATKMNTTAANNHFTTTTNITTTEASVDPDIPGDSPLAYVDPWTNRLTTTTNDQSTPPFPPKSVTSPCDSEFTSVGGAVGGQGGVPVAASPRGSFSSPSYPLAYPPFVTCRFVFRCHGDRERVQVAITDLDLARPSDGHDDPDCDGVDKFVARVMLGGLLRDIGIFCGSKSPATLMSSGHELEVVFMSGGSVNMASTPPRGFRALYSFVTNFGIKTGDQRTDTVCGFDFLSNKSFNGSFTSPNHPGVYPRSTECHYLFYGRTGERVHISFQHFDVEGIPPSCLVDTHSDFIEFSNFNIDVTDRKMSRLCGTKESIRGRTTVVSDGNFFRVTFKSNDAYDATGFLANYQFTSTRDKMLNMADRGRRVSSSGATWCSTTNQISLIAAILLTMKLC